MHMLIELIAGFVAFLASVALAQFGVDLNSPRHQDREVYRVSDCADRAPASTFIAKPPRDC